MDDFRYQGSELGLFANAVNWKRYWANKIQGHLGVNILEVGAGIGSTLNYIEKDFNRWVALEPDPDLCKVLTEKKKTGEISGGVEIVQGYSDTFPGNGLFDTLIYIDVLEHIENDRRELETASRLLANGGKVIILSPAHQFLFSPFDKALGHYRRYNRAGMLAAIPDSLECQEMFYLDSVGFFASLANKLFLRSNQPTIGQIAFWDKFLVPISRPVDKILGYHFGKTIICVLIKRE